MEIQMVTLERSEGMEFSSEEKEEMSSPPRLISPDLPNLRCDEIFVSGDNKDDTVVLDGEVTVRRLAPYNTDHVRISEKYTTDDDVNIEIVKPERDKDCDKKIEKPEDIDPMEVLEWDHQGVGKLPGSNLKVRV